VQFQYVILDRRLNYSGKELRSGWAAEQTGCTGDIGVGFIGPCFVATEDLADLDDARAGEHIAAASMAHVILEHPGCSIGTAVLRQRLLISLLADLLRAERVPVIRDGDDLYTDGRKMSVSIAAPSRRSSLIHVGINIDPAGAPVPVVGLAELRVEPRKLLENLLERYRSELESCAHAETKVKTVP
jgi:hypothetical protein